MLAGINDRYEQALALAGLLELVPGEQPHMFKVNLIPYNPTDSRFTRAQAARRSPRSACAGVARRPATVRLTRGRDIDAACGQLAGERPAGPGLVPDAPHSPARGGFPAARRRRRARASPARSSRSRSSACSSGARVPAARRRAAPRSLFEAEQLQELGGRAVHAPRRTGSVPDSSSRPRSSSVGRRQSALTPRMRAISGARPAALGDDRKRLGLGGAEQAARGRLNRRLAASSVAGSLADVKPPPSSRRRSPCGPGAHSLGQRGERGHHGQAARRRAASGQLGPG